MNVCLAAFLLLWGLLCCFLFVATVCSLGEKTFSFKALFRQLSTGIGLLFCYSHFEVSRSHRSLGTDFTELVILLNDCLNPRSKSQDAASSQGSGFLSLHLLKLMPRVYSKVKFHGAEDITEVLSSVCE